MKQLLIITGLLLSNVLWGQIPARHDTTAFAHLMEINVQWKSRQAEAPNMQRHFNNDIDRIQYHLQLVESNLRQYNCSDLSPSQRKNRLQLLDSLSIYADQKVFPTNSYHSKRTPYFIDDNNVYCAVGYLIQKSGHDELARKISSEHNYDYLADIRTEGVKEWAEVHGFTLDELAWIQPSYDFKLYESPKTLGQGTNGPVKRMAIGSSMNTALIPRIGEVHPRIYIIGEFDSLNNIGACSQFAYFENGNLHCVSQGLFGDLRDLTTNKDVAYISGRIESEGETYSIAIYRNDSLEFLNVPGRENATATTLITGGDEFLLEVALKLGDLSEVWRLNLDNSWTLIMTVEGGINSIARGKNDFLYTGVFDSYTVPNTGDLPVRLDAQNILRRPTSMDKWSTIGGQVPDEILKVKWRDNNFFFAGRDANAHAFGMLHEGKVLALTSPWCYKDSRGSSKEMVIHDFELRGDSMFTVVGEFYAGLTTETFNEATVHYSGFKNRLAQGNSDFTALFVGHSHFMKDEIPHCILIHPPFTYTCGHFPNWGFARYMHQHARNPVGHNIRYISDVRPQYISGKLILDGAKVQRVRIYDENWNLIKRGRKNEIKIKDQPIGRYYAQVNLEMGVKLTVSFWITNQ